MPLTPTQQALADAQAAVAFEEARTAGSALHDDRIDDAQTYAAEAVGVMAETGFDPATEAPEAAREAVRAWVRAKLGGADTWRSSYAAWYAAVVRALRRA